ncbi:hypothetical protein IFM89_025523 [Coptis chinensis]|uniref:Exonuclease V, chloroplastic n=1 Tax=Coptis chinensis TaxID=261450 RepID=A0A835LJD6_9MAGN|nr:hypothetical protein IFM89_025523 [Coptis chinensis]
MGFISQLYFTSTRSALSSGSPLLLFQKNARSIRSTGDGFSGNQKKVDLPESLLHRFRPNKALSVTDLAEPLWCEKKVEFELNLGKPKVTNAMKAGRARHKQLENEVTKKVKLRRCSIEDIWAEKFMNFIIGRNQLSMDGVTRELPLSNPILHYVEDGYMNMDRCSKSITLLVFRLGLIKDVWTEGVIDEIRMLVTQTTRIPFFVDTKTRFKSTLPSEPQQRIGRCVLLSLSYRRQFCSYNLTLEDLVDVFANTCFTLPQSHEQLLLRYERQGDNSLIGKDRFLYDPDLLNTQIQSSLDFWSGEREAKYVPSGERWKCNYCHYASICPSNSTPVSTQSS